MNRPIFLIGYMGSGKSSLGRQLAREMGRDFIDLDKYIETRFHSTVKQIFDERGEDGFRTIERNMIHEVAEFQDVIVACGGGTPCYYDNMDFMLSHGLTIYLDVQPEILALRLALPGSRTKRPLIAGKSDKELLDFVRDGLQKRLQHYTRAEIIFNATHLLNKSETIQTAMQLAQVITEHKNSHMQQ